MPKNHQKQHERWFSCQKKEDGLGVLNLKTQNEALLLKHLHNFFNRSDVPWVHLVWEKYYSNGALPSSKKRGSFWWRDLLKLLDSFKGMAMVNTLDGASCLFWEDLWMHRVPKHHFPELYSFAKDPTISLKSAREAVGPASFTSSAHLFSRTSAADSACSGPLKHDWYS